MKYDDTLDYYEKHAEAARKMLFQELDTIEIYDGNWAMCVQTSV